MKERGEDARENKTQVGRWSPDGVRFFFDAGRKVQTPLVLHMHALIVSVMATAASDHCSYFKLHGFANCLKDNDFVNGMSHCLETTHICSYLCPKFDSTAPPSTYKATYDISFPTTTLFTDVVDLAEEFGYLLGVYIGEAIVQILVCIAAVAGGVYKSINACLAENPLQPVPIQWNSTLPLTKGFQSGLYTQFYKSTDRAYEYADIDSDGLALTNQTSRYEKLFSWCGVQTTIDVGFNVSNITYDAPTPFFVHKPSISQCPSKNDSCLGVIDGSTKASLVGPVGCTLLDLANGMDKAARQAIRNWDPAVNVTALSLCVGSPGFCAHYPCYKSHNLTGLLSLDNATIDELNANAINECEHRPMNEWLNVTVIEDKNFSFCEMDVDTRVELADPCFDCPFYMTTKASRKPHEYAPTRGRCTRTNDGTLDGYCYNGHRLCTETTDATTTTPCLRNRTTPL